MENRASIKENQGNGEKRRENHRDQELRNESEE
jgi:hypothetical protein